MENDKFIQATISIVIKQLGFTHASPQAIELFSKVFEDRILFILRSVGTSALHSNRTKINLFDLCFYRKELRGNVLKVPLKKETIPVEYEELSDEERWISKLSVRVDKFSHIYEFMPEFPPIHTFRQTPLPTNSEKTESLNVKNRMDQSLKSEENMFKLFKSSGSFPPIINYLYMQKKQ